jgi:ElaB/YqjD/DUF883 family membrane-anchored ribosome-binding protein
MASTKQLASDIENVMQDLSGLQANVMQLAKSLSRGAESAVDQMRAPVEATRHHAQALFTESDRFVRRNPWAFVAGALFVGLAFSLLRPRDR